MSFALVSSARPARAEPKAPQGVSVSAAELASLAAQLQAGDPQLRAAAVSALAHLELEALPALEQRWRSVAAQRPAREEVLRVLAALRHAAGSRRADDDTDLHAGVLPLLEHERSSSALAVIEPLLWLRALEAMDDSRALLPLAHYVVLDEGAWDAELRLSCKRTGARALPALLALRSHESAPVRRFALASISALGLDDPKVALAVTDPYLLSQIVRAYGKALELSAMPLIVRLVGNDSTQVREAARDAVGRYGKNAIWQVRELYEEVASQPSDKSWDAERSARELYAALDRDAIAHDATLRAQGFARLQAGDVNGMRQAWDLLLAEHPELPGRDQLAPGYATLGAQLLEHDDLQGALLAYRRALRLAPGAGDAKRWGAQLAYASAELSLSRGVVDLAGYDQALALDPEHAAARDARDRLSGERSRRVRRNKQLMAAAALALLCALGVLAARGRRTQEQAASSDVLSETSG